MNLETIAKAVYIVHRLSENVTWKDSCINQDKTLYKVGTKLKNQDALNKKLAELLNVNLDLINDCYLIKYPISNEEKLQKSPLWCWYQYDVAKLLGYKLLDNLTDLIRRA